MLNAKPYLHCVVLLVTLGYVWSELQCVYHKGTTIKYSLGKASDEDSNDDSSLKIDLSDFNNTQICPDFTRHCYAVWNEDPQNKTVTSIVSQGCWSTMQDECDQSECRANKKPTKTSNTTKFCCCSENFCNANVTDGYVPYLDEANALKPALQFVEHASYNKEKIVIALSSVCSVVTVIVLACLIVHVWSASRKSIPDSIHLMEAPLSTTPTFDLDSLKIQEVVGVGRYGLVCKGSLHNHTVAVKMFSLQNKQYFLNERDIYSLPFMDHSSLPKFIGAEEHAGADGKIEYLLVLTYAPLGSLQGYLINNVIDWPTLCKMAQTITKGLAHLHTEIRKGDKMKMCVAHRDLTSCNVLVKNDGSCMLCDFGFAIRVTGSKYYRNGEKQTAETSSLADVGTLRYMAPEILQGAVNLRDCESSLKQIDVYALGLILWEIATRCSDLFQGMEVPDYRAPFEAEIDSHPTIEQMQVLVARNKARPLFPDIWKDTNPAVRSLKETIEDCWDQDAEARLTALCAEERLLELPHLWERYKAGMAVPGVSPTLNPTVSSHGTSSSLCSQVTGNIGVGLISNSSERSLLPGDTPNGMPLRSADRASSTSENTTETLLTLSPSDSLSTEQYNTVSTTNIKNNVATNLSNKYPHVTFPLQPHQGRNPCIERNLMMEPLDEISVSGNMLLDSGLKFREQRPYRDHVNDQDAFDIYHVTDNTESNSLVTNDFLNQSNNGYHPIPYVQNAVHLPNTMPKQPNLPGNGHQLSVSKPAEPKQKRWMPFGLFSRKKQNSVESTGIKGLSSFLGRKEKYENSQAKERLCSNNIGRQQNTNVGHSPVIKELYVNELRKSPEHVDTEICMINGRQNSSNTTPAVICRVMNSFSSNSSISANLSDEQHPLIKNSFPPNASVLSAFTDERCMATKENGVAKNVSDIAIHKDINGNCSDDIPKRPTSLPVSGYRIKQNEKNQRGITTAEKENTQATKKENGGCQKIVKRVKTPFEIKKGRFSLYDDRVMLSECVQTKSADHLALNDTSKMSLSLPLNIDVLCASQADDFLLQCHQTKCETE